jgi:hypothetical protein
MIDQTILREFASIFRARLDAGLGRLPKDVCSRFPAGCCGIVSEVLAEAIRRQFGISGVYVCGTRYDDGRHNSHAWLEVDGLIIDITADQFDRPPVIVTTDRTWHSTWPNQEHRGHVTPEADPRWWASYGHPIYAIGTNE